jgi:hypothetical protein
VAQWKAELLAQRPKMAKLVANERLRGYFEDRLSGQVRQRDGTPVPGPVTATWKGRNKPRRQDRRWVTAWSPEQISHRLKADFPEDESTKGRQIAKKVLDSFHSCPIPEIARLGCTLRAWRTKCWRTSTPQVFPTAEPKPST